MSVTGLNDVAYLRAFLPQKIGSLFTVIYWTRNPARNDPGLYQGRVYGLRGESNFEVDCNGYGYATRARNSEFPGRQSYYYPLASADEWTMFADVLGADRLTQFCSRGGVSPTVSTEALSNFSVDEYYVGPAANSLDRQARFAEIHLFKDVVDVEGLASLSTGKRTPASLPSYWDGWSLANGLESCRGLFSPLSFSDGSSGLKENFISDDNPRMNLGALSGRRTPQEQYVAGFGAPF